MSPSVRKAKTSDLPLALPPPLFPSWGADLESQSDSYIKYKPQVSWLHVGKHCKCNGHFPPTDFLMTDGHPKWLWPGESADTCSGGRRQAAHHDANHSSGISNAFCSEGWAVPVLICPGRTRASPFACSLNQHLIFNRVHILLFLNYESIVKMLDAWAAFL